MNIAIYCLGYKAFNCLIKLESIFIKSIDIVIIGQDKNVANDYSSEIKQFAIKNNINYIFKNQLINIESKYHIAIGWRWLIKKNINEKLIVLHDSLLPKYRGFNPLVTSLINGDELIGVTALFGSKEYDKGNIISQLSCKIEYPIKINTAIEYVSELYSEIFNDLIKKLFNQSNIASYEQCENEASYSLWRDDDDYFIDWNNDAEYIKRFVDATGYPYKGACCFYNQKIIRINEVTIVPDLKIINRHSGKVIMKQSNKPIIVCKTGLIRIDKAYFDNGEVVNFDNFRIRL